MKHVPVFLGIVDSNPTSAQFFCQMMWTCDRNLSDITPQAHDTKAAGAAAAVSERSLKLLTTNTTVINYTKMQAVQGFCPSWTW